MRSFADVNIVEIKEEKMIRLIFLEQLYRVMTIIKGSAYHH